MPFSITLLGATGLVGEAFLQLALADDAVGHITTVSRRAIHADSRKLRSVVADIPAWAQQGEAFASDWLVCCLGTTLKKAGSRAAFRAVDYDAVCAAAQLARAQGCGNMLVVSALGADPNSAFFYSRVKGQMEQQLATLGFTRLEIVRPSLLLGKRPEPRVLEDLSQPLSQLFNPLLRGRWRRYRAVSAQTVAQTLLARCKESSHGTKITYPTL